MNELKDPRYAIGLDPAVEESESDAVVYVDTDMAAGSGQAIRSLYAVQAEAMRELLAQSVLGTSNSSGSIANVREAVWRAIRETAPVGADHRRVLRRICADEFGEVLFQRAQWEELCKRVHEVSESLDRIFETRHQLTPIQVCDRAVKGLRAAFAAIGAKI